MENLFDKNRVSMQLYIDTLLFVSVPFCEASSASDLKLPNQGIEVFRLAGKLMKGVNTLMDGGGIILYHMGDFFDFAAYTCNHIRLQCTGGGNSMYLLFDSIGAFANDAHDISSLCGGGHSGMDILDGAVNQISRIFCSFGGFCRQ